jgi:hypothetical protein
MKVCVHVPLAEQELAGMGPSIASAALHKVVVQIALCACAQRGEVEWNGRSPPHALVDDRSGKQKAFSPTQI